MRERRWDDVFCWCWSTLPTGFATQAKIECWGWGGGIRWSTWEGYVYNDEMLFKHRISNQLFFPNLRYEHIKTETYPIKLETGLTKKGSKMVESVKRRGEPWFYNYKQLHNQKLNSLGVYSLMISTTTSRICIKYWAVETKIPTNYVKLEVTEKKNNVNFVFVGLSHAIMMIKQRNLWLKFIKSKHVDQCNK